MAKIVRYVKNKVLQKIGFTKYLDSKHYVSEARRNGVKIGDKTKFFGEKKLDLGLGPLITIGKCCKITDGVRILAHSGDFEILQNRFGSDAPELPLVSPVKIGDNVFIGEQTIILPGVTIGDNTVIGAGSVVTSDIPEEVVAAGNPCKVIKSLEELNELEKRDQDENVRVCVEHHLQRDQEINSQLIKEYVRENTDSDSIEDFTKN